MKLSKKRRSEVYGAIHEQVMRTRITLSHLGLTDKQDAELARLTTHIWDDVQRVLGVTEQP